MAYEKLNLKKGDVFTAEHLAHLETGIKDNSMSNLDVFLQTVLDPTFTISGTQSFNFSCNTSEDLEEIKKFPLGLTLTSHITDNNWSGQLRHIGRGCFMGVLTYETKGSAFVILNLLPSTVSLVPGYDPDRPLFTVQGTIRKYPFRKNTLTITTSNQFEMRYQSFFQLFGNGLEIETTESDEILNFYAFDFNNSYDGEFLDYLYLFEISASKLFSEYSFLKPHLNGKILYTYQITNGEDGTITFQKIKQHIQGDIFFPIEITNPQLFEMLGVFYQISRSFSLKGNVYALFNGKYTLMTPISGEVWYMNLSEFDFDDLSYLSGILKIDILNQTINAYIIDSANNALIPLALESILT